MKFYNLIILASFFSANSWAANYYVSTTGNNTNPGTLEAPFRTITYAVSKMAAGDTTYVRGGLYTTEGYINFRISGTPTAPIRLLNYPGEVPGKPELLPPRRT